MSGRLKLVIVTPEKPVLDCAADFAALPARGGELGVLPGHASALVQLKEGILHYTSQTGDGAFGIMGGFAEIHKDEVMVFAEAADLAGEIDAEAERQAVQKARQLLDSPEKDMDIAAVEASLRRSLLRLKLIEHKRLRR
ncbi:MAG: ATP synthase F1 subunit epsilon [Elusimicrobiales bacterium]